MSNRVVMAFALLFSPVCAFAQSTDPVDRNASGPYLGGQFLFGQADKVGDSTGGPLYLIGADVGYVMRRDTWNRIELGLELSTGKGSFKDKSSDVDVDLDLGMVAMIKAGYGYSLGDHAMGVFRAGAGIVNASYEGDGPNDIKVDGGDATGLTAMVGWDAVIPANESLDFVAGLRYQIMNLSFDDLPAGVDEDVQINIPALYLGARARF